MIVSRQKININGDKIMLEFEQTSKQVYRPKSCPNRSKSIGGEVCAHNFYSKIHFSAIKHQSTNKPMSGIASKLKAFFDK
jgi:hypothetical protein